MRAPKPLFRRYFRPLLWFALALPAGALQSAKPDQVLWENNRGQVTTLSGTVTRNSLEMVVVENGDDSKELDASRVLRVTFGEVSSLYRDGVAYLDRGDFENAAAKFALVAGDTSLRSVLRAAARLEAARAWMRQGATEPTAFGRALEELQRFAEEAPDDRALPTARMLAARATRLSGKPAEAAELYRALYKELGLGTKGYPAELCLEAGTLAAAANLDAGDTLQAREIYTELQGVLPGYLAQVPEGDVRRTELAALLARVRLGEGFALLAAGDSAQAKTFFQGQLGAAETPAQRWGATLGLAEALQGQGSLRKAQIEFAKVSAVDHTDRDRAARALIGLAECTLALGDSEANQSARTWLTTVIDVYGDTPSVLKASELVGTL